MIAFDCETTGVDTEEARIVFAAVAAVGGSEGTFLRTWLVNPGVPIPEEATKINGITDEMVADAMPAHRAALEIVETLAARPRGAPVVAYNARYDLTVLDRESRRYFVLPLQERDDVHVVDPLVIDKHLDRYRPGSRRLEVCCQHYRAHLDGAHNPSADAIAAARLAWRLGQSGKVIRREFSAEEAMEAAELREEWERVRGDLPALHEAQCRWADFQARGLAEHFRRKGEPQAVPREWPVVGW
jgi:DNA polymerase III subunit epsilon